MRSPKPSPLEGWSIPPREAVAPREPGVVVGSTYTSAWLGVRATLPVGSSAESIAGRDRGLEELHVNMRGGRGMLILWDRLAVPGQDNALVKGLVGALEKSGLSLVHQKTEHVAEPLGGGRALRYGSTGGRVRIVIVPICGGHGSLAMLRVAHDRDVARALDAWIDSFHALEGERAPVCSLLDPK